MYINIIIFIITQQPWTNRASKAGLFSAASVPQKSEIGNWLEYVLNGET